MMWLLHIYSSLQLDRPARELGLTLHLQQTALSRAGLFKVLCGRTSITTHNRRATGWRLARVHEMTGRLGREGIKPETRWNERAEEGVGQLMQRPMKCVLQGAMDHNSAGRGNKGQVAACWRARKFISHTR